MEEEGTSVTHTVYASLVRKAINKSVFCCHTVLMVSREGKGNGFQSMHYSAVDGRPLDSQISVTTSRNAGHYGASLSVHAGHYGASLCVRMQQWLSDPWVGMENCELVSEIQTAWRGRARYVRTLEQ